MANINIQFTVPDEKATEILELVTTHLGWTTDLGITRPEFLRRHIKGTLKDIYVMKKMAEIQDSVGITARADAESVTFT